MTLGQILRRNAAELGDKTALVWGERQHSYAELNRWANRLANGLLGLGVAKGDRVGVLGRNCDTYVALYFALAKIGAVMVPINFWYKSAEIRYTLEQADCCALISDHSFSALVDSVRAQVPGPVLYYGAEDQLQELARDAPASEPPVEVREDDLHIILYTSGTTGFPKGAAFSHKSHYRHAQALAACTGGCAEDVGAVVYPLFHTGGPDCLVLPHFLSGGTLVVLDGGDADQILAATQRYRITNIYCVPTVWRRLLARLEQHPYDVSSVRRCLGSSDTFPPDLLDNILQRFGADVYVTYGLTEAGCILTVCRLSADDRTKLGSVGCAMPGVELGLMDEAGTLVGPGQVGEVVARTPGCMTKYWNMPERTEEAFKGGWLHSGDLGQLDGDGYLFLAGRAKDIIISGGENIYPLEVERLLKENPKIRDVALVGVPDSEWGESVLAVVVPAPGAQLNAAEVIDFVRDRVAGYKKPRYVEFVDQLPVTTATGKVQKAALRQRFGAKYGT